MQKNEYKRRSSSSEARLISTKPGYMEEVVAVAGWLWISWCALGGADIFRVFFSFLMREGRGSEATEEVFLPLGKKASSYRGAYRVLLFN